VIADRRRAGEKTSKETNNYDLPQFRPALTNQLRTHTSRGARDLFLSAPGMFFTEMFELRPNCENCNTPPRRRILGPPRFDRGITGEMETISKTTRPARIRRRSRQRTSPQAIRQTPSPYSSAATLTNLTNNARKAGVTDAEIVEATMVAAALRAGGAVTHASDALTA
jgi:hypothetical protein